MRLVNRFCFAVLAGLVLVGSALGARDPGPSAAWPSGTAVVSYESEHALAAALDRHPARVVRRVRAATRRRAAAGGQRRALRTGDRRRARHRPRRADDGAALARRARARRLPNGLPYQWQYVAVRADEVPPAVARAAAAFTIAVIDTGADLTAPDLSAKAPQTYSVRSGLADVPDTNGHGTFVAALAAGSSTNGDGIAGVGGDAGLMVVQAGGVGRRLHGRRRGGRDRLRSRPRREDRQPQPRRPDDLIDRAAGGRLRGLEGSPARRRGRQRLSARERGRVSGGAAAADRLERHRRSRALRRGLDVQGARAPFSSTGSHVSLAAPGVGVFSAVSSASSPSNYPRTALPGSLGGLYGFSSGTSFASPQVAGAAALVWAANPQLRADEVASILEQTASGQGDWNAELGYGVLDVAAAVAKAQVTPSVPPPAGSAEALRSSACSCTGSASARASRSGGARRANVARFRVSVRSGRGPQRVLTAAATRRSAAYALARGAYSFTVAALDAEGRQLAVSAPWRVTVPRAARR